MAKTYVFDTGQVSRKLSKIYVFDSNGVARKLSKLYAYDADGIARKIFGEDSKWYVFSNTLAYESEALKEYAESFTKPIASNVVPMYLQEYFVYNSGNNFAYAPEGSNVGTAIPYPSVANAYLATLMDADDDFVLFNRYLRKTVSRNYQYSDQPFVLQKDSTGFKTSALTIPITGTWNLESHVGMKTIRKVYEDESCKKFLAYYDGGTERVTYDGTNYTYQKGASYVYLMTYNKSGNSWTMEKDLTFPSGGSMTGNLAGFADLSIGKNGVFASAWVSYSTSSYLAYVYKRNSNDFSKTSTWTIISTFRTASAEGSVSDYLQVNGYVYRIHVKSFGSYDTRGAVERSSDGVTFTAITSFVAEISAISSGRMLMTDGDRLIVRGYKSAKYSFYELPFEGGTLTLLPDRPTGTSEPIYANDGNVWRG